MYGNLFIVPIGGVSGTLYRCYPTHRYRPLSLPDNIPNPAIFDNFDKVLILIEIF